MHLLFYPVLLLSAVLLPQAGEATALPTTSQGLAKKSAPHNANAAAPASVQHILRAVQKAYRGKSLKAEFSQTYIDKVTGPRPTETGTLQAAKDGRVRFDYAAPNSKTFVFDGNDAFFYEPAAAQVTIIDHFGEQPVAKTMAFLWGDGPLSTAFTGSLCPDSPEGGSKRNSQADAKEQSGPCVLLTPVSPMAGVSQVELRIQQPSFEVQQTIVTDELGNRTCYALTGRKLGAAPDAKAFTFIVPQGVSVLHTRP